MLRVLTVVGLAGLMVPAFSQGMNEARPGTIVYVEGQAALGGKPLSPQSVGRVAMKTGQMLSTGNGKAEVLLAPGVFLRLDGSTVTKMISAELGRSEVELDRGRAEVEVAGWPGRNDLQIDTPNGVQTVLLERGLYEFDVKGGHLRVFDGKASVSESESAKKWIDVKGGHELALDGSAAKSTEFDRRTAGGELSGFSGGGAGSVGGERGYGWEPGYPGAYAYPGEGYPFYGYPGYGFYGPYAYGFYPGFYLGGGFGYGFRGGYGGGFRGRFR